MAMGWTKMVCVATTVAMGAVLLASEGSAQFLQGQKSMGAHIGLSGVGTAPSIGVSGEMAYSDRLAFGGWADTWSYGESVSTSSGGYNWSSRYIAVAGTGAYHFPLEEHPKWDPFAGLALGYFVVSNEAEGPSGSYASADASRVFLGGFGGVRYAFRERLRGVARAGFGASYLTVGIDYRL
jgi:hypothetical protein